MKNNLLKQSIAELQIWKDLWYGKSTKKETKKDETDKTSKFDLRGLGKKRRSKK